MKIKALHLVISLISILIVVIVLSCLYPVFEVIREVDINSGDVRTLKHIFFVKIRDDIEMSRFSKEVRRLGINVPQIRVWKPVATVGRERISFIYGYAIADCIEATLALEVNNISDQERKEFLQDILKKMQSGKLDEIKDLVNKLEMKMKPVGPPPNRTNIEDTNEF